MTEYYDFKCKNNFKKRYQIIRSVGWLKSVIYLIACYTGWNFERDTKLVLPILLKSVGAKLPFQYIDFMIKFL